MNSAFASRNRWIVSLGALGVSVRPETKITSDCHQTDSLVDGTAVKCIPSFLTLVFAQCANTLPIVSHLMYHTVRRNSLSNAARDVGLLCVHNGYEALTRGLVSASPEDGASGTVSSIKKWSLNIPFLPLSPLCGPISVSQAVSSASHSPETLTRYSLQISHI